MTKQKIIVIGGSGFIGSKLVEILKKDHHVRIIDKEISKSYPEITFQCDIRNLDKLTEGCEGYNIIYNLAAEHKDNVTPKSLYDEVNVNGSRNVCLAAEKNGIKKIIFTSSVAVYGFAKPDSDESTPFNPFNDYGRTKMEAEVVFNEWLQKSNDNSLTIIRPTVVFGPQNRGNVYNLLKQLTSKAFIMVGNGKNKKSLAYVENVAAFLKYSIQFDTGLHLFNYIDKPDFNMNSLVLHVKKSLGKPEKVGLRIPYFIGFLGGLCLDLLSFITRKKFPISAIRVKKFCSTTQFSSMKMLSTGFKPPVDIQDGLMKTIKIEFK